MKSSSLPRLAALVCLGALLAGCAGLSTDVSTAKPAAPESGAADKAEAYARVVRQAFDLGRSESLQEPDYVALQGQVILGETLLVFYDRYAGARRLLDFAQKDPASPLLPVFLPKPAGGLYFAFQQDEDFKAGNYFNNYEDTLFDPLYRRALLEYLEKPDWSDAEFERLAAGLKEGARLTPRYADFYPVDLSGKTRKAFQDYVAKYPAGTLSDSFRFYLLVDDRISAWGRRAGEADDDLRALQKSTRDELLKQEIQDTLNSEREDPGRAAMWSLAIPGLGQVIHGDVQGGALMAGLAGAAWWWAISRLAAGYAAGNDATTAKAAFGDAALGIPIILGMHGFASYNALAQAHFFNVSVSWDILSKPRLK